MLEARVLDFFESACPLRSEDALLVAVSGGPDSVAMLCALLAVRDTLGIRLEVAHLDHSLRGKEGANDAAFVTRLAEEHGLALHRRRVNIPELQAAEGGSVEAIARRERYAFLEEARAVAGARWIVTGHNANDQVETFLMNLLRGAGPRGLGGMLAVGPGPMCRPLLETWRTEILEFLEAHDLLYCVDSTNQDLSRTRNWVRHRLLPYLEEEVGASVLDILSRDSRIMNELDDFMSLEADRLLEDVRSGPLESEPESIALDIGRLCGRHPALQRAMLRSALKDLAGGLQDWSLAHIDLLLDLARKPEGSGRLDLPGGVSARREYGRLVLGPAPGEEALPPPEPSPPLDLSASGEVRWGRTRLRWTLATSAERDPGRWAAEAHRACFDRTQPIAPIYIRGLRVGDRLEPLGMAGSQKLSDLLINRKVPRHLRTWVPVLCDNGGPEAGERILWVVGQRRSRHAPVESGTTQVVYFEAETIV